MQEDNQEAAFDWGDVLVLREHQAHAATSEPGTYRYHDDDGRRTVHRAESGQARSHTKSITQEEINHARKKKKSITRKTIFRYVWRRQKNC
jgi:hypothetical protein